MFWKKQQLINELQANRTHLLEIINRYKSRLDDRKITAEYEAVYTDRYYVILHIDQNKEYTLCADILVCKGFIYEFKENTDMIVKNPHTFRHLTRVYWNNGGFISFEKSSPELFFNLPSLSIADSGDVYAVTLTEEKVQYTKAELNEINAKAHWLKNLKEDTVADINRIISNSENRFSYFSNLFEDYRHHLNLRFSNELLSKKNPAVKSAEKIRKLSRELRTLGKKYKLLAYQMEIYEHEFPWITDFKEVSVEEIEEMNKPLEDADSEASYLKEYISAKEYNSLSEVERYQLALDRYWKKSKSNWQIGIAFERYVGYLYEQQGYHVTYFGAQKGLEDLGRDLIAKKGNEILIIQCKYWNEHRTVHEKHIFQLFGSMFSYDVEKNPMNQTSLIADRLFTSNIRGVFITTCPLSDKARDYAKRLNIKVFENFTFDKDYPCIKCNISKTGEKIYHLPFDQQYDRVCIDFSEGEFYAKTIQEAHNNGFRRAYRCHSTK